MVSPPRIPGVRVSVAEFSSLKVRSKKLGPTSISVATLLCTSYPDGFGVLNALIPFLLEWNWGGATFKKKKSRLPMTQKIIFCVKFDIYRHTFEAP